MSETEASGAEVALGVTKDSDAGDSVGVDKEDELDSGAQSVTTFEVFGESLVATRHTIFWTPAHENGDSKSSTHATPTQPSKFFTRGSIARGTTLLHDQLLLSCFREVSFKYVQEGDRIVFACEIKSGGSQSCFFFIVTSTRGADPSREESMLLLVKQGALDEDVSLIAGIPILSSMVIEFRGRGVFGIHLGERIVEDTGFFFETKSLHSMWTAIVSLEKVRDQAKTDNLYDSELKWMLDYFPLDFATNHERQHSKQRSMVRSQSSNDESSDVEILDPEDEGEGGSSLLILPTVRIAPANSFSSFVSNVRILESEPGIARRLFSLPALKRGLNRTATIAKIIGRKSYGKPDLDHVYSAIYNFISSAQNPDDLSVSDVIDFLKEEFGEEIIGKFGYSSAKIDSVIYKVVGQMEPPTKICEGLYLGSEYNAANKQELKQLGISHILNATVEVDKFFPNDFRYHQVCILDTPSAKILPFFERAVEFIETGISGKNATGCLVHCQRGVSRSASFVIAYVMKTQNLNAEDAIKYVKQKRRIVKPNTGFVVQLKEWEKRLTSST